jgi:hypothetical protein
MSEGRGVSAPPTAGCIVGTTDSLADLTDMP